MGFTQVIWVTRGLGIRRTWAQEPRIPPYRGTIRLLWRGVHPSCGLSIHHSICCIVPDGSPIQYRQVYLNRSFILDFHPLQIYIYPIYHVKQKYIEKYMFSIIKCISNIFHIILVHKYFNFITFIDSIC